MPKPPHIPTTWGSNSNPFENERLNSLYDYSVELRPASLLPASDSKISLGLLCTIGQRSPEVSGVSELSEISTNTAVLPI